MFAIEWADEASRELEEAILYIAERNVRAAEEVENRIRRSTQILHSNPRFYRKSWYVPGCHDIVIGNYLIIYEVHDSAREVHILRFFHGARDIAAALAG